MQLFSQDIAEKIVGGLSENAELRDEKLLGLVAEERTRLLGTGIKVIVFLFTTITIIAVTVFGATGSEVSLFGIKIEDPDLFAFASFMVGNVLYVVCTGLFMKVFVMEFIILNIVTSEKFSDDSIFYAFIRSFHANLISFLLIFNFFQDRSDFTKSFFRVINFYAKYYIIILYGIYYYSVLGYFIYIQIMKGQLIGYTYSAVLIAANIMSVLTSFAIFYPLYKKNLSH